MATIESMTLGAQAAQSSQLSEPSAHKRKLKDLPSSDAKAPGVVTPKEEFDGGALADDGANADDLPMSETKRRAQNRAAQRAFRERKERHLRELETRLAELESESRSWKSTNLVLRSQLSLLEEQLNHYRNPPQQPRAQPMDPGIGTPGMPPAGMANPGMANPGMNNPGMNNSGMNNPGMNNPGMNNPGMNNPGVVNPSSGMANPSPGMGMAPENTPSLSQPGASQHYKHNQHIPAPSPQVSSSHNGSTLIEEPAGADAYPPQGSGDFPSLTSSEESPETTASIGGPYDHPSTGSSGPSRAELFCEKLSMACGVGNRPAPAANAPRIASELPGWQDDNMFNNNLTADWVMHNGTWSDEYPGSSAGPLTPRSHYGVPPAAYPASNPPSTAESQQGFPANHRHQPPHGPHTVIPPTNLNEPINFDFGNIATGFGGFNFGGGGDDANDPLGLTADNDMNNLLTNDFAVFDPLDSMLVWDPASRPDAPHSAPNQPTPSQPAQPPSGHQPAFADSIPAAVDPKSLNPGLMPSLSQMPAQLSGQMPDHVPGRMAPPMSPSLVPSFAPFGALGDDRRGEEEVPAASQKFIPCADVWDRICSHPRFGEIDINSMCQELRNKARCSKTGVVLDEQDVDSVLKALR